MTEKSFPERLFDSGVTALIPVIPPGATLVPSSTVPQNQLGKVPGKKTANGLWTGINWRAIEATIDDVRTWVFDGANIGLKSDAFPAVDIDCTDEALARIIEEAALGKLGPAPVRIGRAPKRLLMYRTDEPFARLRLIITKGETKHLVEILGAGQQYLVYGTHPATGKGYEWLTDPTTQALTTITRAQAEDFLNYLQQSFLALGLYDVERVGEGRSTALATGEDKALLAPSIELLREAVEAIPNNDEVAPTRDDYIRMGYAIRAAAGEEHEEDGYAIFAAWAGKHEGSDRVEGNPETWRSDWRRMKGPFAAGYTWLAERARGFGFSDAEEDFDVVAERPTEPTAAPLAYSEQWLANAVVRDHRGRLRYCPQSGKWLVWSGARWLVDEGLRAEDLVSKALVVHADKLARMGATPKEQKENQGLAMSVCSARKLREVMALVKKDESIAVLMENLDHDQWILNTPGGIVDLRTGAVRASDPDALMTKLTTVPPDFTGACPEFRRFIAEATGGDRALEAFLQRYVGYCLTGSTKEEQLMFVFGQGGNGKTKFLECISGIMGDYAKTASMDTFLASNNDRHTTDLAMLAGARLVTASELSGGKRWDEQRLKSITGGDRITARFMRQDNFVYTPHFKLLFIGNHQPELREVDDAFRRRIQMVPFTVTPKIVDKDLGAKLREEWPAILAWAVQGCLDWQRDGLKAPASVQAATHEYFENEDSYGQWLKERCLPETEGFTETLALFGSYREWANQRNIHPRTVKPFSNFVKSRGFEKAHHPTTRRAGYKGITLLQQDINV